MLKNGDLDINPPERAMIREAYDRYTKTGRVLDFIELNRICREIGGEGLCVVVSQHASQAREYRRKHAGKEPALFDAQINLYRDVLHASHGMAIQSKSWWSKLRGA